MKIKRGALAVAVTAVCVMSAPVAVGTARPLPISTRLEVPASDCPLLIAHRGGVAPEDQDVPENSMPAFARAVREGVDGIETDVRFTSDGYAVLMHDERVERTTNGRGRVAARTLAQIRRLRLVGAPAGQRFATGYRVPTLGQVLAFASRRDVLLVAEYKGRNDRGLVRRFARQVAESGARTLVGSFSGAVLRRVRRENPAQAVVWFSKTAPTAATKIPESADLGLLDTAITAQTVTRLAAVGVRTAAWFDAKTGTDSPTGAAPLGPGWEALARLGVAWITTDHPAEYRAWEQKTTACQG